MKLIRYSPVLGLDPVESFADLREEMDRFFSQALPSFRMVTQPFRNAACPINLYRNEEGYALRAEVPGFNKKDLQLEVVDGSLVLSGRQQAEDKKADEGTSEVRFTRTIPLPDEVDAKAIKAEYADGVLTVSLPKRPETKPRQIAIDVK